MLKKIIVIVKSVVLGWVRRAGGALKRATAPARTVGGVARAARDVVRPRTELVAENAILRQQLIVLKRIRGEFLKLGIRVSKRTIQKYTKRSQSTVRARSRRSLRV